MGGRLGGREGSSFQDATRSVGYGPASSLRSSGLRPQSSRSETSLAVMEAGCGGERAGTSTLEAGPSHCRYAPRSHRQLHLPWREDRDMRSGTGPSGRAVGAPAESSQEWRARRLEADASRCARRACTLVPWPESLTTIVARTYCAGRREEGLFGGRPRWSVRACALGEIPSPKSPLSAPAHSVSR